MKQRREKALQNAKDRKIGKENTQIALQANTRANRASKDTQDIKMKDIVTTGEDSTDNATTGRYEEKYDFINKALLESIMHITEVTKTDHPIFVAKVKSTDKMVMLSPLFDGSKPEVAK